MVKINPLIHEYSRTSIIDFVSTVTQKETLNPNQVFDQGLKIAILLTKTFDPRHMKRDTQTFSNTKSKI